jgi:hypothetical protein
MSALALRRFQTLLDKVGRGEIRPDQVQQQFGEYLREQATPSTRNLVELSVGLLADLLHVEGKFREAMLAGLLPAEGPLPPPPAPSGADLMAWFQSLSTYASEQSARAVARHQMLVDRIARAEIAPTQVQEQGRRYLEQHAPEFVSDVMGLGLKFVERLQRSSASFTEGLYDRVLGPEVGRAASAPEPPVCLDLIGTVGSVVSGRLVVENTRRETTEVGCQVSEFAARAFGRRFRAPLDIVPSAFTLAPGEQRDVTLFLTLDPALFAAGADYAATLQISGARDRDLIVQIQARAEAAPAAPRSQPPVTVTAEPATAASVKPRAPRTRRHR